MVLFGRTTRSPHVDGKWEMGNGKWECDAVRNFDQQTVVSVDRNASLDPIA